MTKEEQQQLLSNFIDDVRAALLRRSERWPDNWDGFELRWLAEAAFKQEAPEHKRMGVKRFREFKNDYIVNDLY